MRHKLKAEKFETTSLPKLINVIKRMWVVDLPQQYFVNLAHSMPRKLKAVLENKGQMTKYGKCRLLNFRTVRAWMIEKVFQLFFIKMVLIQNYTVLLIR